MNAYDVISRDLGVHVIRHPSGRWGFVGTLPAALGYPAQPTTSDIMGGRVWHDAQGNAYTMKFPTFDSEMDARNHAEGKGVGIAN